MASNFPDKWRIIPLEDCMEAIIDYRGKTPRKSTVGIPLITAKVVKDGRITDIQEFIPPEDYQEWMRRGIPKVGDVLLTTEAPLGQVAQLNDEKVALAQRIITLRGKNEVLDNRFLKYLLQSRFVQQEIHARATGTTVLGIRQTELRKVPLPVPPLSEQRVIAHVLGSLDDKIELNRQMNQTLEAIAQAIFKSWFVNFDPVRAKMDRRFPTRMDDSTSALFPNSFEDSPLGAIPRGWRVGTVDDLCTDISNGGTPKRADKRYWSEGEILWFKTGELSDGPLLDSEEHITNLGLTESSCKLWPVNTILMALYASPTVGRLGLLKKPATANQACCGLQAKPEVGYAFLFQTLLAAREGLQQVAVGSAQQNISQKVVREYPVLVPPTELMQKYQTTAEPLYDLMTALSIETKNLADLRETLLPKLISGELPLNGVKTLSEANV